MSNPISNGPASGSSANKRPTNNSVTNNGITSKGPTSNGLHSPDSQPYNSQPYNSNRPAKLRPVELLTQQREGEAYVVLRDPLALSDQTLMVPQAIAPLLVLLDGERTSTAIAADFGARYNVVVDHTLIDELVDALDACYLLDNARAKAAWQDTVQTYHQTPARPMLMRGAGYPASVDEMQRLLDGYLAKGASSPSAISPRANAKTGTTVVGLLSPHIDYPRGGPVYSQVWQAAAAAAEAAEVAVIFATDHYGRDPFTLTRQSYATPYGMLPLEANLTSLLAEALGPEAAFAGELRHHSEHSVELVTIWLHHMRRGKPIPIVPILCGSLYQHILHGTSPATHAYVRQVMAICARELAGRRALIVASGDLAHVGPAFGGAPLNQSTRDTVRAADEALLAHMAAGDAEGFFRAISAVKDRNNVCGVTPIYLTMTLLEALHGPIVGDVTGYAACRADTQNSSAVTIAGVTFRPA